MHRQEKNPWMVLGDKITGATHVRSGAPCQDAILWRSLPEQRGVVLALADGHGSSSSPYSEEGAAIAVQVAVSLLEKLVQEAGDNLALIKRLAEEQLPRMMVRAWEEAVLTHNRKKIRDKRPGAREDSRSDGVVAMIDCTSANGRIEEAIDGEARRVLLKYGSTLLAILATARFFILFQLGDGDILVVENDGSVSRPLPSPVGLAANETHSLCARSAWKDVQLLFQPLHGTEPPLLLAATDGYVNSFASEAGFFRVGSDYLALLREDGLAEVAANLKEWLAETSENGSGDDIALGMVLRETVTRSSLGTGGGI